METHGNHVCQHIETFTCARDVLWEVIAFKCVSPKLKKAILFSKWQGEKPQCQNFDAACNQQRGAHVGHCNDVTRHADISLDALLVDCLELLGVWSLSRFCGGLPLESQSEPSLPWDIHMRCFGMFWPLHLCLWDRLILWSVHELGGVQFFHARRMRATLSTLSTVFCSGLLEKICEETGWRLTVLKLFWDIVILDQAAAWQMIARQPHPEVCRVS